MRERRWLLPTLYGLLLALAVSDALKATRPKFKIATSSTTSTTTEEPAAAESADDEQESTTLASADTNGTTGHTLTGIPQIDYIWDPNLPRELNGYNLSDYPFYASMPEDIDFKCDGLHDGFYASVPHKCQVYHHCLFGTRYDFLCANFTAFDQKTFICHFVSEVDCANSKKYWHRNDALYKTASSSTTSTTTTSTTTPAPASNNDKAERPPSRVRDPPPRRARPPPRRPVYDDYYEYYEDDDYDRTRPRGYNRGREYDDYDDRKYRRDRERDRDYRPRDFRERDRERFYMRGNRRDPARARDPIDDEPPRARVRDQDSSRTRDIEDRIRDGDDRRYSDKRFRDDYDDRDTESSSTGSAEGLIKPAAPPTSVFARPRAPPKLRRPVPLSEQDKYSYSMSTTIRSPTPLDEPRRRPATEEVDEPRRRPTVDEVTEPRRRPAVDDVDEPRKRPALADVEEPRRRPALDDLEEPRRRPAIDNLDEPRRRPLDDDLIEQRRRPSADSLEEPRSRRPTTDGLEESRRRPIDVADDDYYYEDDMEEARPRWQMRGRPLRDRDFSDKRYRDRPFRSRYRDEEDDVRPRKPERSRDRFYERERERNRDRSLDRTKDRNVDRDRRPQDSDRSSIYNRPIDRDRESERPRAPAKSKDLSEINSDIPKKSNVYERTTTEKLTTTTTTTTSTTTTTTEEPERETPIPQTEEPRDRSQKYGFVQFKPEVQQQQQQHHHHHHHQKHSQNQHQKVQETSTEKEQQQKYWKPTQRPENNYREKEETTEDYAAEYYDEDEEPAIVPVPPPRPTVRVIKRPFLPSRGGNPNPRGLSPVGSKAPTSPRQENPIKHYIKTQTTTTAYANEDVAKEGGQETYQNKNYNYENKQTYNNYKNVQQSESPFTQKQQQITENYDVTATRTALRRPDPEAPKRRPEIHDVPQKPVSSWSTDYGTLDQPNNEGTNQGFDRANVEHSTSDSANHYSSSYKNQDSQDQLSINGSFKIKQKINEVTHRNLQDIPESEYDVTLNEALTPNLSQEPSLPSGFVLPLHRQLGRDAVLQPSENTYKFSRPVNQQQQQQQQQQQHEQQKQHNAFAPSSHFAPSSTIARSSDRGKTVYFRTPETIQISGTQYRQQRGHWSDYTGF